MTFKKRNWQAVKTLKKNLREQRKRKLDIYERQSAVGTPSRSTSSTRQGVETPDGLIDEVIAARLLGVTPRTLQNRRSLRKSPEFIKRGRRVFYRRSLIEELATLPHSQW